jgi:hypothetical protein
MSKEKGSPSQLVAAALALDEQLRGFEATTTSLEQMSMDSQKGLERAGKALGRLVELEDGLGRAVEAMVRAFQLSRQRQEDQAKRVGAIAAEVQKRTEAYQGLLRRFSELGQRAATLNEAMKEVMNPAHAGPQGSSLGDLQGQIQTLTGAAEEVMHQAESDGFADIARQADGLRQQLLAVHNRLTLLHARLTRGAAQS